MYQYQNHHCHHMETNVRIADSIATYKQYAERAAELGQSVLSSCEHGWQGNYWECYKAAKDKGLKLLFATEAYWVKDRTEKDNSNCHIFLAAKNENGRQALNDILSEANITGFYGRPRVDVPLLLSLPSDDVWMTTACVAGWKYDDVDEIWETMHNHFGKNFYFEVQYHDTPSQIALNTHILKLRDRLKAPIIMGCDSHYIHMKDAQARTDFLLSKDISYPEEEGWYLDMPDGDTAYERFAKQAVLSHDQIVEAITNTNVFADVAEYDSPVFNSEIKMPSMYPDWTQDQRDEEYKRLVWQGWDAYKAEVPEEKHPLYIKEIEGEIQTVIDTHMADYFIDNHHIIKKGIENGGQLTQSGRGSAVSFLSNKLLGFTEVDRVAASVKMYPERFMSTERILSAKTLPDIDFNMADPEPFALAQQQILGEDHAYPMIAYGTMKASAAWKLYAKSQSVPFDIANEVSNQLKRYDLAMKHADEDEKESINVYDYIEPQFKEIFERSKEYRGTVVSWSIAPCSYLLYQGSIRKEIGLTKVGDKLCCCMDGHWAEECHFLKNDLLTVQVVNLIYKTFHRIGMEPPSTNELLKLCENDQKVWDIYAKGATMSVNQVEKNSTSARARIYKPHNVSELCAFIAAIRPGFKSMYKTFESRVPFSYGVKAFDDLIQTPEMPNSFVLYQEQEMEALHYAGIPMSECYTAIKNIAKKRAEKVLVYKEKFKTGFEKAMVEHEGKTEEQAKELSQRLWQIVEDSSSYSFNCVSGDTRIQRIGQQNATFWPTIDEMYRIMNDVEYAKATRHSHLYQKYQRYGYGNALSMFDDERVHKNQIVGIYPSGEQETFEVKTRTGKSIVCTMNHRFPTPNGKKTLSELNVGDVLYCVGEYEKNRDDYSFTNGDFESNFPKLGERGFQPNPDGASVVYNTARAQRKSDRCPCEECGKEYSDEARFELHHKDFNRKNNTLENFQWLCVSCHKKAHYNHGRRKIFEKGLPTYLDEIVSIEPRGLQVTYDIEMADPAHTFVSENGLVVSNCSHSYCMALDSLYCAWLKANHPLEFYETALRIYEKKGDKDKMNELKEEAESYFNIHFPPFRFGQDNRNITANNETNSITNSLAAIKGFGKDVCSLLYECGEQDFYDFYDILKWLDARSFKSAKVMPLVKIDYFREYGNVPELSRLVQIFDFFNQGTAKKIKKDKLSGVLEEIVSRHGTDKGVSGNELKSYTITDMDGCLAEVEQYIYSLHLPDLPYRVAAQNQKDILGYVDLTTGLDEDRRKLYILDAYGLTSKGNKGSEPWLYKLKCKSVGSGKMSVLSVAPALYMRQPIKEGDIIFAEKIHKDYKGYWNLDKYILIPG